MGDSVQLKVDESLQAVLGKIQKDLAEEIKNKFSLEQVTVFGTLASQILAAHYTKKTKFEFKIRKTARNHGIIEFC